MKRRMKMSGLRLIALLLLLPLLLSAVACQNEGGKNLKPQENQEEAADKKNETEHAGNQEDISESDKNSVNVENQGTGSEEAKEANSQGEKEALTGGRVIMGITQEPDFLDPHLAVAAGTKEILFNLFEGLVKMSPTGEMEPCLATGWEVEDEGKTLRFTLREGVKFHNGQDVTAEDVVYSISRAAGLDSDEPLIPGLAKLTEVSSSKDGKEIIVKQEEPNLDLPSYLTCAIVPKDYKEQKEQPVGTGPFMFDHYTPQVELSIKKNPDYWNDKKAAYLDKVDFRIFSNMDTAYLQLMSGELDIFPYLTQDKAASLEDSYNISRGGANMVQLLALNNDREPLNKREVREAINLATDRKQLIELIMGSYGTPLASGMTQEMGEFYNQELAIQDAANPEAAKAKLKEAGYPDGIDLTITVPGNYQIHVDTANVLAAQLKEAGIKVKIETVEWGTWLERVYAGRDYESTVIALTFEYSPSDVMNRYASDSDNDFINFKSERYDELVALASKEVDSEKRLTYFHEMQAILAEETASIFLQDPQNLTAVRKVLDGYTQYPAYVQDMSLVYFTEVAEMEASKAR